MSTRGCSRHARVRCNQQKCLRDGPGYSEYILYVVEVSDGSARLCPAASARRPYVQWRYIYVARA